MKFRVVHLPTHVSRSGVRLAMKRRRRQGPAHARFVAPNAALHGHDCAGAEIFVGEELAGTAAAACD